MNIYITGGIGFIGSNLVEFLNAKSHTDIYLVDHLRSNDKWKNLVGLKFLDIIPPNQFDTSILTKDDVVIHLGACSSTKETDADFLWSNNVIYSRNLIDDCIVKGTRIIYASSASVYGEGEQGFNDIESLAYIQALRPLNPYAFSKQKIDEYVLQFGLHHNCVGLRFFNVWGPKEHHKRDGETLISKAKKIIDKNKYPINIFDDPQRKMERDFIYVKDVCKVIYEFIELPEICGIFNVGTGISRSWDEMIAALMIESLGVLKLNQMKNSQQLITHSRLPAEMKPGYQFITKADITKLKQAIPGLQFASLEESMKDFVNYEQLHKAAPSSNK